MKKLYFLTISVFFLSVTLFAQDKKWSVEANYIVSVGDSDSFAAPGIADIGVKYRFLDFNIVKIGAGLNVGLFKFKAETEFKYADWLIQPKIFAEFSIPGIKKLHPSIGLGYTFIESKHESLYYDGVIRENTTSSRGFNANIGLSYDISKRFFLQVQYDYVKGNRYDNNSQSYGIDKPNLGYFKAGVGFRF